MDVRAYRERVRAWWSDNAARLGADSAYYLLAASAFLPLLQVSPDLSAATGIVASVGTNLLASIIERRREAAREKHEREPTHEQLLDAVLDAARRYDDVRQSVDELVANSGVLLAAQETLTTKWDGFAETLLAEVRQLGGSPQVEQIAVNLTVEGGGIAAGRNLTIRDSIVAGRDLIIYQYETRGEDPRRVLWPYLTRVLETGETLPLSLTEPSYFESRHVTLSSVYTALDAKGGGPLWTGAEDEQRQASMFFERGEVERGEGRTPLVEVANAHRRLVLVGDAGTGKSAFASYLCLCMAGELRGGCGVNIDSLNQRLGDDVQRPPMWRHGALLPIFVRLREFAVEKHLKPNAGKTQTDYLLDYLRDHVHDGLGGPLLDYLLDLKGAGALLVLDGLDEVAASYRQTLKQVIEAFAMYYPACRILITSRPYAYPEGFLRGFEHRDLAQLTRDQVRHFAERWYRATEPPERAEEWAQKLITALGRKDLWDMASQSPLVLTMMAMVHGAEQGELPRDAAELYDRVVEMLLRKWQQSKTKQALEDLTIDLGLAPRALRRMLEWLAYQAHAARQQQVSNDLLIRAMRRVREQEKVEGKVDYDYVADYLDKRAGILIGDGADKPEDRQFHFPHLSVQEYLAAKAMIEQEAELEVPGIPAPSEGWFFPDNLRALVMNTPSHWREVARWAGDIQAGKDLRAIWEFIDILCCDPPPAPGADTPPDNVWLLALIAGQALAMHRPRQVRPGHGDAQERVRLWLRRALEVGALPPPDRAAAGRALAVLGDDRHGVCQLDENGVPVIDWVTIPAGPFLMGNTKETDPNAYDDEAPQHTVDLPAYRISRYPVTNAQYEAFVRDDGYTEKWRACWTDAGWAWKGDREGPDNNLPADYLLPNHPRVNVRWYEAHAFSQWLGAKLDSGVRLPTEAEWEKAARGTDGRRYPWGNKFDASRCNMGGTGIGQTSAVGILPLEDGPWGVESPLDMSGNVWEWTGSNWGEDVFEPRFKYPYDAEDGREDISAGNNIARVLRGGAFSADERLVRCACRNVYHPLNLYRFDGFRVCAPSGLPL